jgi:hypothetical protein
LSVAPHPSATEPQFAPRDAHEEGLQPQTLGAPPPPQACPPEQAPQLSVPPQPSATEPQVALRDAQVEGVHEGPAAQIPPVQATPTLHVAAQWPQFAGSLNRSVSQPFAALPSQSA